MIGSEEDQLGGVYFRNVLLGHVLACTVYSKYIRWD